MVVQKLGETDAARLRAATTTYTPVGLQTFGPPPGYHRFERSIVLARTDFQAAADDLFSWRVQERAGLQVQASDIPLRTSTVVLMRLGLGPVSLRIPCRVVHVIDEPHARGFAYGTLPGHPEAGEERFVLEVQGDGSIRFTVSAFSRPATRLANLAGPVGHRLQSLMTSRYLRALDDLK